MQGISFRPHKVVDVYVSECDVSIRLAFEDALREADSNYDSLVHVRARLVSP